MGSQVVIHQCRGLTACWTVEGWRGRKVRD
jgi:hypothetical protein